MVLDEYDTMKEDVWPILQPILRQNGGWAWFIGTPKGKQKLYDLYNLGKSGNKEWASWHLKASESGLISKEQLENSRVTMSEQLYNQEFECAFLEGEGSVFRNVRSVMHAHPQKPKRDHTYTMGVDLAKVQKLYDLYNLGKSGNKEWASWHLKASESGLISKEQLENSRVTMSEQLYNQEFECAFLEGEGSVFRNVRSVMHAHPQKPKRDHTYTIWDRDWETRVL